jgi:diguanylate cyclase (GGDEF)-like protein
MHRELVKLASVDPLTALLNRRAFFERAEDLAAQLDGSGPFSAIMLDIDHFKQINDTYGHDAGDRAIRALAGVIAASGEAVGRFGGEEFAILLAGRALTGARELAEQLRQEVTRLRLTSGQQSLTFTCSFGVSEWRQGDNIDEVLRRADMALYAAKAGGRNRVAAADESLVVADYANAGRGVRAAVRTPEAPPQREVPTVPLPVAS